MNPPKEEQSYDEASMWDKFRIDIHSMADVNPKVETVCPWDNNNYDTCATCTQYFHKCAPRMINAVKVACEEMGIENIADTLLSHDKSKETMFKMLTRVVPEDPVTVIRDIARDIYDHLTRNGLESARVYIKSMAEFLEGKMAHLREADRLNAEAKMWDAKAEKHEERARTIAEMLNLFDGKEGDEKYKGN